MSPDDKLYDELTEVLEAAGALFDKNFSVTVRFKGPKHLFEYRTGAFFVIDDSCGRETEQQICNCSAATRIELAHTIPAFWGECVAAQSQRRSEALKAVEAVSEFVREIKQDGRWVT